MPPEPGSKAAEWSAKFQDILADNMKIRQGLHDDDAIPYVEWGRQVAEVLAMRLAETAPDLDEEQATEKGFSVSRLLVRLNWLVTYRNKKDAAWLVRTFGQVNNFSREMWGDAAPTVDEAGIAAWIADHANHTDGELIRDLMGRYAPPGIAEPAAESGDAAPIPLEPLPAASAESAPPPDAVFGAVDEAADPPNEPGGMNDEEIE